MCCRQFVWPSLFIKIKQNQLRLLIEILVIMMVKIMFKKGMVEFSKQIMFIKETMINEKCKQPKAKENDTEIT